MWLLGTSHIAEAHRPAALVVFPTAPVAKVPTLSTAATRPWTQQADFLRGPASMAAGRLPILAAYPLAA